MWELIYYLECRLDWRRPSPSREPQGRQCRSGRIAYIERRVAEDTVRMIAEIFEIDADELFAVFSYARGVDIEP